MQCDTGPARGTSLRAIPAADLLATFDAALVQLDRSEATRVGYLRDVRLFFAWYEDVEPGKSPATAVTPGDLAAYRMHLLDMRRLRAATVNRKLQAVRRFYRHAQQSGLRPDNPTHHVKAVRTPKPLRPAALTTAEVHALLRAAGQSPRSHGPRNYALVQLGLQAGLRVSELARLVGGDLVVTRRAGTIRVRDGKGHRERTVPLNTPCRRALLRYFETHPARDDQPIFVSERGRAMAKRSIQHTISAAARRANIERIEVSAHTLRHTFATRYLEDNPGDLVGLAQLMGHESLDTTAVYVRPSHEDLAQRLERSDR